MGSYDSPREATVPPLFTSTTAFIFAQPPGRVARDEPQLTRVNATDMKKKVWSDFTRSAPPF